MSATSRSSRRGHIRFLPVLVGIEYQNVGGLLRSVGPEILLVDNAILIDDEGHHASFAVGHGPGDDAEAADHAAIGEVAVGAARRIGALAVEQAIVVAVVAFALLDALLGVGDQRPERALGLAGLGLPIKAVLLARRAEQPARIGGHAGLHRIHGRVVALGVDDGEQGLHHANLVMADVARLDLGAAGIDVEAPAATVLDQRDGHDEAGGVDLD